MAVNFKQFYYKKNRLQQLRGFICTIKNGNITRAAKELGLTQSAISLQIQSLERDLGTKLFVKNGKRIKATEDALLLEKMAIPHLQAIDGLYEKFLNRQNEYKNQRINLAIHSIATSYLLPKYLKALTDQNPNVKISIKNIAPSKALEALENDELDCIIYPNLEIANQFSGTKFATFDPVLIMTKEHPLAKKKKITLKDISKYNTVRIDKNLITLPVFESVFKEFKFKTNVEFENGNWDMIKNFVRSDIGLGFVSTICLDENDNDLVYKKLNDFFPTMDYYLLVKKGRSPGKATEDLIKLIDPEFAKKMHDPSFQVK